MREPLQGVLDHARYQVALAKQYAAELAEKTWTDADTAALAASVTALDTARSHQIEERGASQGTTREQAAVVSEAKAFTQQLRTAVPLVLEDHGDAFPDIARKSFAVPGGQLGQHPTGISSYLNLVLPPLKRLDPHLAGYFDGKVVSALAQAHKAKLDQVGAEDLGEANLPEDTRAVYEQKGRVVKLIERLNAIGKLRFHGQAGILGKFNKDILVAARKERPTKKES